MADTQGPPPPIPPGEEGSPTPTPAQIDRDITSLRRAQGNPNTKGLMFAALLVCVGLGYYLFMSGEEPEKKEREETVSVPDSPSIDKPPVTMPTPPPFVEPAPQVAGDPFAEEKARLLIARIKRLQKEMDQRRRSKMLVVSDAGSPTSAALAADGATSPNPALLSPAAPNAFNDNPNTPRMGNVGPVLEQIATPARLLRTTGYTITEGTIIPGVLETAINSELPGLVRSMNAADVYSHDGSQLLIPKGSRLVGRYQSSTRRGQVRIFIIWTRVIRADGMSILINSPGQDPLGRAGLEGDVDTHFFKIFGAAILLSVIDAGLDIGVNAVKEQGGDNTTIGQGNSGLDRAGEIALQDSIRIAPTIHIDQGARISIMVARDLDFEAVEMALLANQR